MCEEKSLFEKAHEMKKIEGKELVSHWQSAFGGSCPFHPDYVEKLQLKLKPSSNLKWKLPWEWAPSAQTVLFFRPS